MLIRTFEHSSIPGEMMDANFIQVETMIVITSYNGRRLDCFGPVVNWSGVPIANHYYRHRTGSGTYKIEAGSLWEMYEKFISQLPESLQDMTRHMLGMDR